MTLKNFNKNAEYPMSFNAIRQEEVRKIISIKNSMNMLSSIICNFNSDFKKIFIMFGLQKKFFFSFCCLVNKQKMTQFVNEKNKKKCKAR